MLFFGALAQLGLARAFALQGPSVQGADVNLACTISRTESQNFLGLWKDVDIPILKQAQAEYAKLQ